MGWLTSLVKWAWVNPGLALLAGGGLYLLGELLQKDSPTAAKIVQGSSYVFLAPGLAGLTSRFLWRRAVTATAGVRTLPLEFIRRQPLTTSWVWMRLFLAP